MFFKPRNTLFDKALLKNVSRSFSLSMNVLPKEMRDAVSLAYLLARATDSVADTAQTAENKRLMLLESMGKAINNRSNHNEEAECCHALAELAPLQSHQGEAILMRSFARCLSSLRTLPDAQQALIRSVLNTIIQGQVWDLSFFQSAEAHVSPEMLDRYTYQVAGCVGEFWTKLGFLTLGNRFSNSSEETMLTLGIAYGKGLQLVNILRDQQEDAQRGRVYVAGDSTNLHEQAKDNLEKGIEYASRLHNKYLRFASILPALIGKATLELINPMTEGKVKISRSKVRKLMLQAFIFTLSNSKKED